MDTKRSCAFGIVALVVCAQGYVYGAASWLGQPYVLNIPTSITTCGQAISGSINLTLDHDSPCTLSVSAAGGTEVLKKGSSSLTTYYKIISGNVPESDLDWVGSGDFLTHMYTVLGSGAGDTITLWVKGVAPGLTAPDAGVYTATVTLTVSWAG